MSLFLCSNRSLFTCQVIASEKPLYVTSLITNFASQSQLPNISSSDLGSINELLNGLISSVFENYIDPLINRNWSKIDRDDINFINVINSLTEVVDDNEAIEIIIAGVKAAKISAHSNDRNIELLVKTNELARYIAEELHKKHTSTLGENSGSITLHKVFRLAPLYIYYHKCYGIPQNGQGYDTKKLGQILIYLENEGIHPYRNVKSLPKNEPFAINGYYPLYSSLENVPGQNGESIEINNVEYFMELGVERFFGNYEE